MGCGPALDWVHSSASLGQDEASGAGSIANMSETIRHQVPTGGMIVSMVDRQPRYRLIAGSQGRPTLGWWPSSVDLATREGPRARWAGDRTLRTIMDCFDWLDRTP
jgi:hypothetical protein